MIRLSWLAVLFLFGFIGIIMHKLGLWLPFGIIAMIAVAGAQRKRALAAVAGDRDITTIAEIKRRGLNV